MSCAEQNFCYFPVHATDSRGTENDIAQNKIHLSCSRSCSSARHGSSRPHRAHACHDSWHARHQRESYRHASQPACISPPPWSHRLRHGERFGLRKARNAVADVGGSGDIAHDGVAISSSAVPRFLGAFITIALFLSAVVPALSQSPPGKAKESRRNCRGRQNCNGKTCGLSARSGCAETELLEAPQFRKGLRRALMAPDHCWARAERRSDHRID